MPYLEIASTEETRTEVKIKIKYSGADVDRGRMNALDLGPALLGIGEMVGSASRILYGDETRVRVEVHADFKHASFGVELFATSMADGIISALTSDQLANLTQVLGFVGCGIAGAYMGVSKLLKWQRDRKIDSVERTGDQVRIVIGDEVKNITVHEYNIFIDPSVRSGYSALAKPLDQPGVDQVDIQVDELIPETIDKSEREFFDSPPLPSEDVSVDQSTAILEILSLSFRDRTKWSFAQGESTFSASMADDEFLARVSKEREPFRAGDALKVILEIRTTKKGKEYKFSRKIVKVLEHLKSAPEPPPLMLDL